MPPSLPIRRVRGLTLVELLVAVGIAMLLAAIAIPSYTGYVQRSRVGPALDALSSFQVRMEQRYQDQGHYANPGNAAQCALTVPTAPNFTFRCEVTPDRQGFTARADGAALMPNYVYTIDHQGNRRTLDHPNDRGRTWNCWSVGGGRCTQ